MQGKLEKDKVLDYVTTGNSNPTWGDFELKKVHFYQCKMSFDSINTAHPG